MASADSHNIEIEVDGDAPSPEAVAEFWRGLASMAAELLDPQDLVGEDHALEETAE